MAPKLFVVDSSSSVGISRRTYAFERLCDTSLHPRGILVVNQQNGRRTRANGSITHSGLPSGEVVRERFRATTMLQMIFGFVESRLQIPANEFVLYRPFPRCEYTGELLQRSLSESGLAPRASLFVLLNSQRGVVRESAQPFYQSGYDEDGSYEGAGEL